MGVPDAAKVTRLIKWQSCWGLVTLGAATPALACRRPAPIPQRTGRPTPRRARAWIAAPRRRVVMAAILLHHRESPRLFPSRGQAVQRTAALAHGGPRWSMLPARFDRSLPRPPPAARAGRRAHRHGSPG